MTAAPRLDPAPGRGDPARPLTVAVAGNPNSGKSTLINAIAGSRLQVGNWAGVTVEKKEASFEVAGRRVRLVDLPGIYSLSPWSQEELVARDYLAGERPDVIVDVVDATNLERNLYLTVQLLELGIPVVMALNIHDEAEAKGYRIDVETLEARLGIRVIPTSATRGTGLEALVAAAVATADARPGAHPARLDHGAELERAALAVSAALDGHLPSAASRWPRRWTALKVLEGDPRVTEALGPAAAARLAGRDAAGPRPAHRAVAGPRAPPQPAAGYMASSSAR